mmetsp:Transcript_6391/g.9700  ORF Transcript_6391/g.9700 Transcript_6391/m.9700 type:complete len:400 (+) Transcript_6391:361-1560(+)
MSVSEWNALAHEVLRQVSGQHLGHQLLGQLVLVGGEGCQHAAGDLQAVLHGLHRIEQGLLVLLEVLVVGPGQALEGAHEPAQVAEDPAGLAPQQLECVRVLLLGHQGAACAVGVRQSDTALIVEDDEVLRELGQVGQQQRGPPQELRHKVPITHRVQGVEGDVLEAQLLGEEVAVDAEGVASQGPAPQGQRVHPGYQVHQTLAVSVEGGDVAHHPVAEQDGLCRLQVCKAGHEQGHMVLGQARAHIHQLAQQPLQTLRLPPQPQPHVCGHLVISASPGVELAPHLPNNLSEPSLICSVNVFITILNLESTSFPFFGNLIKPISDFFCFFLCNNTCFTYPQCIRFGPINISFPHFLIKSNGVVELFHDRISVTAKSTTPQLHFLFLRLCHFLWTRTKIPK